MCACASVFICVCECVGCVHIHVCIYTRIKLSKDILCLETVCIRLGITFYYLLIRNHIKLLYTDLGRYN